MTPTPIPIPNPTPTHPLSTPVTTTSATSTATDSTAISRTTTVGPLLTIVVPRSDPSPATPSVTLRRSIRRIALTALAFIAAAGAWALRPIESTRIDIEIPAGSGTRTPPGSSRATIDVDAFAAPLWVPPPVIARAEPPKAPPPPAPLKLQLIGITKEIPIDAAAGLPAVLRAALYDPDTDTLYIVAAGERVGTGRFAVSSLTLDAVELSDGRERRTLSLRTETHP